MIHLAHGIAATSTHKNYHHAVVVEIGGKIVGAGANTCIVHAEAVAVANALKKVASVYRATVWSFRVTNTGKLAMAKPCGTCQSYLRSLGIKTVYYSDRDGAIQKMRL